MTFFVDAHLPRKLVGLLQQLGSDAVHTLDLPEKNASSDQTIVEFADKNNLVVMTKDSDFVDSHLLLKRPRKLMHITIGNISNDQLLKLIEQNFLAICTALEVHDFIELSSNSLVIHEREGG
jgi:predicted nuclease of predicted toxin-antitoxin system